MRNALFAISNEENGDMLLLLSRNIGNDSRDD
jgi:hypothetical protein